VFEEDPHETARYCERIASQFAARNIWVRTTRKISRAQLPFIRDELAPDVIFCLGWRTLIPTEVLECVPLGAIAVHDSLLPRLRGFAPTNWGLILGHDKMGATLFQLADSVDAGDVYFQKAITPGPRESYQSIQERIAEVSVELFDAYLDAVHSGRPVGRPQDATHATYTCARGPGDGEIDWNASSLEIERLVRALGTPAPGAFTYLKGSPLIIDEAYDVEAPPRYEGRIAGRVIDRDSTAGTVDVLCGAGILRIVRVRTADGQRCAAAMVMKSVRESLGLNPTQEILKLRARLDDMESRLAQLEPRQPMSKAG
jgi:methionyl-tRNA formyltransferase